MSLSHGLYWCIAATAICHGVDQTAMIKKEPLQHECRVRCSTWKVAVFWRTCPPEPSRVGRSVRSVIHRQRASIQQQPSMVGSMAEHMGMISESRRRAESRKRAKAALELVNGRDDPSSDNRCPGSIWSAPSTLGRPACPETALIAARRHVALPPVRRDVFWDMFRALSDIFRNAGDLTERHAKSELEAIGSRYQRSGLVNYKLAAVFRFPQHLHAPTTAPASVHDVRDAMRGVRFSFSASSYSRLGCSLSVASPPLQGRLRRGY